MSFIEHLLDFKDNLIIETGDEEPLIKIGVSYKVYDAIMRDLSKNHISYYQVGGPLKIMGIEILPRQMDDF